MFLDDNFIISHHCTAFVIKLLVMLYGTIPWSEYNTLHPARFTHVSQGRYAHMHPRASAHAYYAPTRQHSIRSSRMSKHAPSRRIHARITGVLCTNQHIYLRETTVFTGLHQRRFKKSSNNSTRRRVMWRTVVPHFRWRICYTIYINNNKTRWP